MTMNELQSDLEQEQKAGEERVLRCRRCSSELADAEHEIPASRRAYMNPHGLVREIVALTDARNVVGDGRRHAEHSWFPGRKGFDFPMLWSMPSPTMSDAVGLKLRSPSSQSPSSTV